MKKPTISPGLYVNVWQFGRKNEFIMTCHNYDDVCITLAWHNLRMDTERFIGLVIDGAFLIM